jgi:hypothetical protein
VASSAPWVNFACLARDQVGFKEIKLVANIIEGFIDSFVEYFAAIKTRFTKSEDYAITNLAFSSFKVDAIITQVVATLGFGHKVGFLANLMLVTFAS